MIPMLPIYISYFAGGRRRERKENPDRACRFHSGLYCCLYGTGSLGRNGGRLPAGILDGGQSCIWSGGDLLRAQLPGGVQCNPILWEQARSQHRQYGIFLRGTVWYRLFYWLDALCRGFPWIGSDAGLPAGPCSGRAAYATGLFPGIGDSFYSQRGTDWISEINL